MNIYGYCRISTRKQNIERQIRNIKAAYSNAIIIQEVYTGTTIGREKWKKLLQILKEGDVIVFDSVSRMSRDAGEGFQTYQSLFQSGIELVFLKEPHINTATYKKALQVRIDLTGNKVDVILRGINEYLMLLAEEQIKIAFAQAEKEVLDLRQRTKEGIQTARINGKQIGQLKGSKLVTKKSQWAKKEIFKYAKDFGGTLKDVDVIRLIGINPNTYYKYKREIKESENTEE